MKRCLVLLIVLSMIVPETIAQLTTCNVILPEREEGTVGDHTIDVKPCVYDGMAWIQVINMPGVEVTGPNPINITGGIGIVELTVDPGIIGFFDIGIEVTSITNQNGCNTWIGDSEVFPDFEATSAPLPLTLLNFEGESQDNTRVHILKWTTTDEVNFSHFIVEHSTDGIIFLPISQTSGGWSSYTYTFEKPVVGDNYYRLKMVDMDGTYDYSQIISLRSNFTSEIKEDIVSNIYPNPTHGVINIEYAEDHNNDFILSIFNSLGQVIKTIDGAPESVSLVDLNSGIYHLQFINNGKQFTSSISLTK